ncbi:MAG: nitrous oxide reductase family maturation protein NosD [Candidatus Thorarchaeota archaeon]
MENYPRGTGKLSIAVLVIVIIAAAGLVYALNTGLIPIGPTGPTSTTNTTNPYPILDVDAELDIVGDTEMIAAVQEHGFAGSGIKTDPYIIENLSIVSEYTCISIQNVEASFIIRNCELQVATLENWGICIYIGSCVDASVVNCRVEGGGSGIEFFNSDNGVIMECDVRYSWSAINMSESHWSRIEGNLISNTTWGITLVASNLTSVYYNEIMYSEIGILSQFSFRCMIDENLITRTTYGIDVQGHSGNWTIAGNEIVYNSEIGIRFDDTVSEMIVYRNKLGWNTVHNAWDDGSENRWEYVSDGNSWHDYSGTGWYTIPGNAESIDHYPLLLEG